MQKYQRNQHKIGKLTKTCINPRLILEIQVKITKYESKVRKEKRRKRNVLPKSRLSLSITNPAWKPCNFRLSLFLSNLTKTKIRWWRMVEEWNVSFCSQIQSFYAQTRRSKWRKSRGNWTVVKENRTTEGGGGYHRQPVVLAVPVALCSTSLLRRLLLLARGICDGVSMMGHFGPS